MSATAEVHLPDEILSEIPSPALEVPDAMFASVSETSPFVSSSESSSALLLVCKSWLRVSIPLLYRVVVLRSTDQAISLRAALTRSPDRGRFIKKLRVEGGFGEHMHDILKGAPKITNLYFTFNLYASDSSSGLVSGLPLINPTRLIFFDAANWRTVLDNMSVRRLIRAIEMCLSSKWTNLVRFLFF
jgi:hypothetical protein